MIGQTVSHYRVLDKLGAGGMGIVYKAEDTKLGRTVALKFLRPGDLDDEEANKRFLYEARSAAALNHPNICTVYEIDTAAGFLALEYVDGETVEAKRKRRPLPVDEALDITLQICEGLQAAHEKDIIHRDIKSANVMVSAKGTVKIMDFGLARLSSRTRITQQGSSPGTPAYMAPESFETGDCDARSDIWAIGVVLYEMIAGRLPFEAETDAALLFAILNKEPEPLSALRTGLPAGLERIVEKALRKDRGARYQHVEDLAVELRALRGVPVVMAPRPERMKWVAAAAIAALAVAGFWIWRERDRDAHEEALKKVEVLADTGAMIEAYRLAQQLDERRPGDPRMAKAWEAVGPTTPVLSEPPGADVFIRDYLKPESEWTSVGRTPLQPGRMPMHYVSLKMTKPGYADVEWSLRPIRVPLVKLAPIASAPADMVYVAGTGRPEQPTPLDDFWLDRYEVSNAEYKKFVDAGGYREQKFWTQPFVDGSRTLSWEEAIAKFVDTTGRPGPATWDLGVYPEGAGDLPVTGVSWYEAAAYAAFVGKELPTVHHWRQTTLYQPISSEIVQLSNFAAKSLAPRGKFRGASFFGSYDMAGNAKEWCWNEIGGKRYILGGAWTEPSYMFTDDDARSPFERAETFGFRCVRYTQPVAERLKAPMTRNFRDYAKEKPVSDEVYRTFRSLYAYDRAPLEAKIDSVDETSGPWRLEKISLAAAYGNERLIAHLYLPLSAKPPYQTVVNFPGGFARIMDKIDSVGENAIRHFVQSGRAVLFPVYKGTFERKSKPPPRTPLALRDQLIQMCKDLGRSIDYLESRTEIDPSKIGYHGLSLGTVAALPCVATEPRLRVAILASGGLLKRESPPETDPFHFAPRVRMPVLMINGKNDFEYPMEQLQVPLFRLLGTPDADKRHFVVEGGHVVPRNLVIKESLDWLDKYLGHVRTGS